MAETALRFEKPGAVLRNGPRHLLEHVLGHVFWHVPKLYLKITCLPGMCLSHTCQALAYGHVLGYVLGRLVRCGWVIGTEFANR